jgi:DNA-directed RNA polymerase specialized sigma24 family protein
MAGPPLSKRRSQYKEKLIRVILRAPFSKTKSHEDLFLWHYAWLVKRAIQITQGRRDEADDLVQDLYIQLVNTQPDLDFGDDERVRGYLFNMMRNLSVSNARRAGRDALSNLLVVDYESAEFALATVDRSKLVQVRSALARVCEYTTSRMHTSRSASVLALRFFLGYYPSEIVRILQTTPVTVDKLLQAARLEARVFLERPGTLRFLGQEIPLPSISSALLPEDPAALFAKLRTRIFARVKGECLAETFIQERYAQDGPSIETSELAHIVSCASCLNLVSHTLGMADLSERHPWDKSDHQGGGDEPPAASGDGPDTLALKKRDREIYEHAPSKLQFAVDGEIRVAHRIAAARNELQVKLDPLGIPAFLEVISEQGVRLVYLQVEPSQLAELKPCLARAEFSNGRFVELKLSFVSGELIATALYYDPLKEDQLEAGAGPLLTPSEEVLAWSPGSQSGRARSGSSLSSFVRACFPFLDSLWPLGMAAAMATLVLLGVGVWIKRAARTAPPTATALIEKAREVEGAKMASGAAIHSTFSLETRSQDGKVLANQTVDSWRSAQPRRSALRLLDAKGRIVGGSWKDASGKVTTFSQGRGIRSDEIPPTPLADRDSAWEMIPGEEAYSAFSSIASESTLQTSDVYDIEYERRQIRPNVGILRASLILDRATLRPVSETVDIESGNGVREYRFQRLTYEVVAANNLRDSDFAPDSTLATFHPSLPAITSSANRTAHLALQALQLLNNLGPEVESFVDLDRLPDGSVQIGGVLPTQQQKAAIVHVFQSLHSEGQLKLALHANGEPTTPRVRPTTIEVESLEPVTVAGKRIPFDGEIRSALSTQGLSGSALDERITQIASDALEHSARMHREVWTVSQVAASDFSTDELRTMQPQDLMMWMTLLDKHIRSAGQELDSLAADLTPLVRDSSSKATAVPAPSPPLQSLNELSVTAKAINRDGERLDRLLTGGLTLSASKTPTNHNVADIAEILTDLRIEESKLHATLERLQTAVLFGRIE